MAVPCGRNLPDGAIAQISHRSIGSGNIDVNRLGSVVFHTFPTERLCRPARSDGDAECSVISEQGSGTSDVVPGSLVTSDSDSVSVVEVPGARVVPGSISARVDSPLPDSDPPPQEATTKTATSETHINQTFL